MIGKDTMQIPADTRLAEERAGDDVVEIANLTTAQPGAAGTIFISTAMGGHRPRAKYLLHPGRRRCRGNSEPDDGTARRTRHHLHLDGHGRAPAAGEIFLAAWVIAAEL